MIIAEHTVRIGLLPRLSGNERDYKNTNVLDIGCRDFKFTNHFKEKGANVYSVDIDKLDGDYYMLAISDKDGACGINHTEDPQAKHITTGSDINMMTIDSFSKLVGVNNWHIIKMDVEGEEMNILNSASHPIADQVSVEFHAHTGKFSKKQIDTLLEKLSKWYYIENRYWEERHGCSANYWDILLVKK